MKKRLLALLLVAMMFFSILPTNAFAEEMITEPMQEEFVSDIVPEDMMEEEVPAAPEAEEAVLDGEEAAPAVIEDAGEEASEPAE